MNNFLVGTGVFDESFACLNSDEELLTYLGASWRSTLTSHIHKDDVDIFIDRVRRVIAGTVPESCALLRFITSSGETRVCRVRIYNRSDDKTIFVEVIDIENACNSCMELVDAEKRTEWFLSFEDEILINYNYLNKKLDIFKFTDAGRMNLINNSPYDRLGALIRDDLENRETNYSYRMDYDVDGERFMMNGTVAYHSNERTMLYGIIRKHDGNGTELAGWGDTHDALTGLYNRSFALSEAKKMVSEHSYLNISFIILNIDNFKTVNETFGTSFGNKVLQKLSVILNEAAQGRGFAAHFRADEFLLVLIDIRTEDELRAVMHGIIFKLQYAFPDVKHRFTLSMGVAEYPRNSMDYDILLKKAERALYIAKFKGKARYIIYKEAMHGEITDEASDVIKPVPHNREEQFITIKDILSSVAIANSSSPDTLTNTMDQALVKLLLKYRCDALTVYCGRSYLPVFRKGHYPTEPESAFFLRNPKVRALFNSRGISYVNLMHLQNEPIEEYHTCLKNCGITSSLQIIIGEINSPLALFSYDCFNDMGSHTGEETNDLLFFSYMIYAILVKCDVFQ